MKTNALPTLGLIGFIYIIGRSAGKISGAYLGAVLGKLEEKKRKDLGIGILYQAGVSIELSLIVSNEFALIDSEHAKMIGTSVITTFTATSIVFEIIVRSALRKAVKFIRTNRFLTSSNLRCKIIADIGMLPNLLEETVCNVLSGGCAGNN